MAYKKSFLTNLVYLDSFFHAVSSNIPTSSHEYWEGSDDENLNKWEQVDDRFGTGFGSTYEVVVNDFTKREDNVSITIFGDKWLHIDSIVHEVHGAKGFNAVEDTPQSISIPFKDSLPEVLQRVYSNGVVTVVGDFSQENDSYANLNDVISYLEGLSDFPDYFIFNGVEGSLSTDSIAEVKDKLIELDNIFMEHSVNACCIFTSNNVIENIDTREYASLYATPTHMLKFSVGEWATHHLLLREYKNQTPKDNCTDLDDFFSDSFDFRFNYNKLSYYILDDYQERGTKYYKELVYVIIKRFVLKNLFALHRECFYITLLYKSISGGKDGKTYDYYYGTEIDDVKKPYNLMANFRNADVRKIIGGAEYGHKTKYSNGDGWNLFKNKGQFVAICLHTGFSENLWAWQQGQSSCYEEFVQLRTTSDSGSDPLIKLNTKHDMANLLLERVYRPMSGELNKISPPIFMGTGCSMFTISEDNIDKYKNGFGECPIEVWITRDNYSASITIKLRNTISNPDVYQSIEFGKMSCVETDNYIFPLFCGGGSTGLSSEVYAYYPINYNRKTYATGNVYNLDINNICLSNSNILHPTKFFNCSFSNFKILTTDGTWKSVFAHEQGATITSYPNNYGYPPDYAMYLNTPAYNIGNTSNGAYPFLMQNWSTVGSSKINKKFCICREPIDNVYDKHSFKMDSIVVAMKDINLSYGTVPNCWRAWDRDIHAGEFIYNGKKYLAVPCGWEGRLWNYGRHLGVYNSIWTDQEVVDDFEKLYYGQHKCIDDKLIIELGDVNV